MILLDTHVLLWLLADEERIGPQSRSAIEGSAVVHYSAVSIAEVTIKQMIGRLQVHANLNQGADDAGLQELPLRAEHAKAIDSFPELNRHDPFDRLLLAQARVERCRFLTADGRLLTANFEWVADART